MQQRDPLGFLGGRRPSPAIGVVAAAAGIALTTLLVVPLKEVAPVAALLVVPVVWVLVVSSRRSPRRYIRTDPGVGYRFAV